METSNWSQVEKLLAEWREDMLRAQRAHFYTADWLDTLHLWLGVPVVVLTSIMGTTVFATLERQVDIRLRLALGAISVIAAVLASLQTFFDYAGRAEKHRLLGSQYGILRRQIDVAMALPVGSRDNLKELLEEMEKRMADLATEAPQLPKWVQEKSKTQR